MIDHGLPVYVALGPVRLREWVGVEHSLAHLSRRQGPRARYQGTSRNLYDVRRAAILQKLETCNASLNARPRDRPQFKPLAVLAQVGPS
jgi:hypothetical protein